MSTKFRFSNKRVTKKELLQGGFSHTILNTIPSAPIGKHVVVYGKFLAAIG
jgi:hypothetical protein